MLDILKKYFDKYVDLTNEELTLLLKNSEIKEFNKKELILSAGKVCEHKFFILSGLVRIFQLDGNGNEVINQFGIENWWFTNLESFINRTPSQQSIQALENTVVLCINTYNLEQAYKAIPKLEKAFRIITENMLIAQQRKDEVYMKQTSKERYYNLVEKIPDFAQRVLQYMIASYLNITPEYLSEIRKK